MTSPIIQTAQYRGVKQQPLHNVLVYSPTIIWINKGTKQLLWRDQSLTFHHESWLVVPANQYLSFINMPTHQQFHSRGITFIEPPPDEWIDESLKHPLNIQPSIEPSRPLKYGFDQLFEMQSMGLSRQAQQHLLYSFYAQLKAEKRLHLLFPNKHHQLKERLAVYFSMRPSEQHLIEDVAAHFNMSRATLIRKLSAENTRFRDVLTEIRMGYGLSLLQESKQLVDVALACGYQSTSRFSARFKQQFGLTPNQYVQTLNHGNSSNTASGKLLAKSK